MCLTIRSIRGSSRWPEDGGPCSQFPCFTREKSVGAITVGKAEAKAFSERQIQLLQTFADQAVIAIENVRLFEAEQQRTHELSESLEQQTATSEVLKVVSSSPGNLEPVFDAMLQNAVRICGAKFGNLMLREGDAFRVGATHGAPQAYVDYLHNNQMCSGPILDSRSW
jgi:FOG: GAF domain